MPTLFWHNILLEQSKLSIRKKDGVLGVSIWCATKMMGVRTSKLFKDHASLTIDLPISKGKLPKPP